MRVGLLFIGLGLACVEAGCATQTKTVRAWRPEAAVGRELVVRLPPGQFTVDGERVDLYRKVCPLHPVPSESCSLMPVGTGRVVDDTQGSHVAVVEASPAVPVEW